MAMRIRSLLIRSVLLGCVAVGTFAFGCESSAPMTTSAVQLPAVMPADFGFIAAYGVFTGDRVDTFEGTFTKNINSETKSNPTAELRLTSEELASLYQDLRAMHILDYPADFRPKTRVTASTPTGYSLEMQADGMWKTVAWPNADDAETSEAKALQNWFDTLRKMIESKPEYQRMPPMERLHM